MATTIPTIPKQVDIYEGYKDKFSEKARKQMFKRKCTSQLLQYNHPTTPLKAHEGYDPYPDGNGVLSILPPLDKDDYAKQLYRTFCKLGVEFHWERRIAPVKCYGLTIPDITRLEEAVDYIANTVNALAEADYVKGHLTPLAIFQMSKGWNDDNPGRIAVYTYVAIDFDDYHNHNAYKKYDELNLEFNEGGIPKELENLNVIREK